MSQDQRGISGGSSRGMSRRTLLRGAGGAAFAAASAYSLTLFNVDPAKVDIDACQVPDISAQDKSLVVSNWPGYIDPRKEADSTLAVFQERTGISVTYQNDINDNAEFFAKVRNQLGACEGIERDMMILTDWMAARMIGLGWVHPLDPAKIPNVHKNLIDPLRNRQWDQDLSYHVPWQSGLTGIAYNADKIDEVGSFTDLISRDDLRGKITLLAEMRDTMGFMLRVVGANPDKFTDDEWANAVDRLREVVSAGQVRSFTGNDYLQDLTAGNIVACEAWSGDVIQAQFDNPAIKFVAPEEGLSLWSDNMLVPGPSEHTNNAEAWMDYFYEPEVAAKLAAWVNYICPVKGAREEMEKIDPSLVDNKLIFPDDEQLAVTFDFMPLTDEQTDRYEREWSDVTGG